MYDQISKNGYQWGSHDGDRQVGMWWICISKLEFLKKKKTVALFKESKSPSGSLIFFFVSKVVVS